MKNKIIICLFLLCSVNLYAQLKIVSPNGGEKYYWNNEIPIRWEGVPADEQISIYYSTNTGDDWILITNEARGLEYIWKGFPQINSDRCMIKLALNTDPASFSYNLLQQYTEFYEFSGENSTTDLVPLKWSQTGEKIVFVNPHITFFDAKSGDQIRSTAITPDKGRTNIEWSYELDKIFAQTINNPRYFNIFNPIGYLEQRVDTKSKGSKQHIKLNNKGDKYLSFFQRDANEIYDAKTYELITKLEDVDVNVESCIWDRDDEKIIGLSIPTKNITFISKLYIWSSITGELITQIPFNEIMNKISIDKINNRIAASSLIGNIYILDLNTNEITATLSEHDFEITAMEWSPDGKNFISSANDLRVLLWDMDDYTLFKELSDHKDTIWTIDWKNDSKYVALGGQDTTVQVFETENWKLQYNLMYDHPSNMLSWNPVTNQLAALSKRKATVTDLDKAPPVHVSQSVKKFTILTPELDILNVDIGETYVGVAKDTLVEDFITNNFEIDIKIDSVIIPIHFAENYKLLDIIRDTVIKSGESFDVNVRFFPQDTGFKVGFVDIHTEYIYYTKYIHGNALESNSIIESDNLEFIDLLCDDSTMIPVSITNTGTTNLGINDIQWIDNNTDEFDLSGVHNKLNIPPDSTFIFYVAFKPKSIGFKEAVLMIWNNSINDTNLRLKFAGRKEKSEIEISQKNVIYSNAKKHQEYTESLQIINNGTIPQYIQSPVILNNFEFKVIGKNPIPPGETTEAEIRFYSENSGIYDENLVITDSCGTEHDISLFAEVKQSDTLFVEVGSGSALPDETINIPIKFTASNPQGLERDIEISYNLEYYAKMLYSYDFAVEKINDGFALITPAKVFLPKGTRQHTENLQFLACVADRQITDIIFTDREINDTNTVISKTNGSFNLEETCLDEFVGKIIFGEPAGIKSISPNPATSTLSAEVSLIDEGFTELYLLNAAGEKIRSLYVINNTRPQIHNLTFDISGLSSGQYFVCLESPSGKKFERIMIIK